MSSMYDLFKTDEQLESEGVWNDYGSFRIKIARAGGANKRYEKLLAAKVKPYRRAIESEVLENDRVMEILREVFAETIVLGWETKVDDKFVSGIEQPDGTISDFSTAAVLTAFKNLPDIFLEIKNQAEKSTIYRKAVLENQAKN